jgi:hypothetical protein
MTRAHVLSALLGSAFALGIVVLLSMSQVLPAGQHVIVSYGPSPRDMVQINQGTPYVVPAGKVFVLTGLGGNGIASSTWTFLMVNGKQELLSGAQASNVTTSVTPVPLGFTVHAGSTIDVSPTASGATSGRAWGYLADQ